MRRSAAAVVGVLIALACACVASAADIGANDDTGKYAFDGGAFFTEMADLGLRQTVLTARFVPGERALNEQQEALDRAVPLAVAAGLRVSLAVYPYPPRQIERRLTAPRDFAAYVSLLARRYPDVKRFVILNEPNQPAFMRPQFAPTGKIVSAATAGRFLAVAYDALKLVDRRIEVIGLGLSPRGNDDPDAPTNVSTSPVRFLAALGAWYRASGRRAPLMDGLSFHPYPNRATDPLERGYAWPNAGFTNLSRVKQALWDAFHGTKQRTTLGGLELSLDEVGWQVDTSSRIGYTGVENVPVTSEAKQASIYGELVRGAHCDDDVAEVNIFGFYDDTARNTGFQSALNRADGSPRPSAAAVSRAISDGPSCAVLPPWRPTRRVVGAQRPTVSVQASAIVVQVTADEGAAVVACAIQGALTSARAQRVLRVRTASSPECVGRRTMPQRLTTLRLPRPPAGMTATVAVRLAAEANPARTSVFTQLAR